MSARLYLGARGHDLEDAESDVSANKRILKYDNANPSLNPQNWSTARKTLILAINFGLVVNATMVLRSRPAASKQPSNISAWKMITDGEFFRFPYTLLGIFAAGPPGTAGGICADLYAEDLHRGHAILGYNMATQIGAVFGPVISGWAVMHSCNLPFWTGLGIGTFCFTVAVLGMPETNHNVVLDKRAKQIQKTHSTRAPRGPLQDKKFIWKDFATKTLLRPLAMPKEQAVLFSFRRPQKVIGNPVESWDRMHTVYGIYDFNTGQEGLTFIGSESEYFSRYQHNTPSILSTRIPYLRKSLGSSTMAPNVSHQPAHPDLSLSSAYS
ncbi:hypothetical protein VTL71DRAFT_5864 [Oculimacula yallundae]|uniref:Uncharacterized protein n=1 Tax=Oculimacula yallundae TaxID=86028 RepID=A0ABR4BZQ2_9HELO